MTPDGMTPQQAFDYIQWQRGIIAAQGEVIAAQVELIADLQRRLRGEPWILRT